MLFEDPSIAGVPAAQDDGICVMMFEDPSIAGVPATQDDRGRDSAPDERDWFPRKKEADPLQISLYMAAE